MIKLLVTLALPLFILNACGMGGTNSEQAFLSERVSTASDGRHVGNSGKSLILDYSSDLKGPDLDANGIRDDIDAYLLSKNFSEAKLKAAQQHARVLQAEIIVEPTNKLAIEQIEIKADNSVNCLFSQLGRGASALSEVLEKLTTNTPTRLKAYLYYNSLQGGSVTSIPDKDTCE